MLPAGLGVICVSQKALEAAKNGAQPPLLFRLRPIWFRPIPGGYFPYTPSLPMMYGLRESLTMLAEEGLENVLARHAYLAAGVRAAVFDGLEAPALRNGADVVLQHRVRNHGAGRNQRRPT